MHAMCTERRYKERLGQATGWHGVWTVDLIVILRTTKSQRSGMHDGQEIQVRDRGAIRWVQVRGQRWTKSFVSPHCVRERPLGHTHSRPASLSTPISISPNLLLWKLFFFYHIWWLKLNLFSVKTKLPSWLFCQFFLKVFTIQVYSTKCLWERTIHTPAGTTSFKSFHCTRPVIFFPLLLY